LAYPDRSYRGVVLVTIVILGAILLFALVQTNMIRLPPLPTHLGSDRCGARVFPLPGNHTGC
jgi:hypothetical protein